MGDSRYTYSDLTWRINGCAMEVHRRLGNGFQEVIYQCALAIEFNQADIPFEREVDVPIFYREQKIGSRRVDLLINKTISVELKAVIKPEDVHLAQAINYLEAFNLEVGLLINFGAKSLEHKRVINNKIPDAGLNL